MSESAISAVGRREETATRIWRCAQELTERHGLDGWTMEQLAETCGASRRTLFNYYPGKVDAVLGEPLTLSPEARDRFRAAGPGSNLVDDLPILAQDLLEPRRLDRADIQRTRRLLLANPRLLSAAHARFEQLSADIVELIREREGRSFDAQRARIAVRLIATLFDAALEDFLDDPEDRTLPAAYDDVLRVARQLLA